MLFEAGQSATYKTHTGTIRFVDESCVTIGLNSSQTSAFEPRLVVYANDFDQIQLHHTK